MNQNNKICLGLVSEITESFINQAKLCISSFRRNAGKMKNIPIIFVTNNKPLTDDDRDFFIKHFSPIEFIVKKRIDIIPPASKFNILDAVDSGSYDVMIYMDCDTVVLRELDDMLTPLLTGDCDFLCRRGGDTDRSCFLDIKNTLNCLGFVDHPEELPKFNTGVFAFRSNISEIVGKTAKDILPKILNKNHLQSMWMGEQCAFALAVIMENIKWAYLDEIYNSWGNLDNIRILHCFKSRYKFNRTDMFRDFNNWRNNYGEIIGERLLIEEIEKFIKDFVKKTPVYVIYVEELQYRKNAILNSAKENNVDITLWRGLYGNTSRLTSFYKNGEEMTKGHSSLCVNWLFLFQHLSLLNDEWFVACEDDIDFSKDFYEKIEEVKSEAITFGLNFVYIGWLEKYPRPLKKISKSISSVHEGFFPYGLQCILIHRSALEILINTNRNIDDHIDITIGKNSLPKLKWGVCDPSLVEQKSQNGTWKSSLSFPTLKKSKRCDKSTLQLKLFCQDVKKIVGESPTIVEIGSFMGESSLIFAEEFPKGKIICIDPWVGGYDEKDGASHANFEDVEEQFDLRMNLVNNIEKIKGYSTDHKIECDLVYIDACHKYECVVEDIKHWIPLTKKIISGHDYVNDIQAKRYPHIADVRVAVNEVLGNPDKIYGDGSWWKMLDKSE
jgi:hypothetical protein